MTAEITEAIKNLQSKIGVVPDGIWGPKSEAALKAAMVDTSKPTVAVISGVDVSHHNGAFDWEKCKAQGNQFAFIKATEGVTYVDPQFQRNWNYAEKAGLLVGAYHFFRSNQDAMAQATHFLKTVGSLAGRLPAVLDWETEDGMTEQQQMTKALLWLKVVEDNTGKRPIIYSGSSFLREHGLPVEFTKYALWVAHYGVSRPKIPPPWPDYTFWQYTDAGGLDKNVFKGSPDDLRGMAG